MAFVFLMPDSAERLHAIVSGVVQGVNFRNFTRSEAGRLGLTGWVRNRSDGTVEALAEGPRPALERLLAWLQHGPPAARVTEVQTAWSTATGEFEKFNVRW
jgi:acylphosphatase